MRFCAKVFARGSRFRKSAPRAKLFAAPCRPQRVRQPVAKSRHIGKPAVAARFFFSHSSAQARMRSRDARGSMGGGTEVSTGGSGASFCCGANFFCGARGGAGGCCRPGAAGAFDGALTCGLPEPDAGGFVAPGFDATGFRTSVLAGADFGAAGAPATGAETCRDNDGGAQMQRAHAKHAIRTLGDDRLPAAAIFSSLRERRSAISL